MSLLLPLGRIEEAERLLRESMALDPLNMSFQFMYIGLLLTKHDYEGLLRHLRHLPEKVRHTPALITTECLAYFDQGDVENVSLSLQRLLTMENADPQQTAGCETYWHLLNGDRAAALASYQRREALIGEGRDYSYVLGNQALLLGDIERAMDWFERALVSREQRIIFIRTDHREEAELKANTRFQALLRKMRLDDESLREMGYL
ncbi:MAG: hypothetical protein V7709_19240, partial [Halioglobus sp.]